MTALTNARNAVLRCFDNWRLWLIQFVGNPLLIILFAGWLLIPVANTLYVLLNALGVFVLLAATVALHGGTLNYFSERPGNEYVAIMPMFFRALRNILAILICAAAIYLLWMLMDKFDDYQVTVPTYLRSTLSASLRKHISVSGLENTFAVVAFALRWILIPGLVLPYAAAASNRGFPGLGRAGFFRWKNAIRSFSYWLVLTLAAVVGVFATQKLLDLTPNFATSTYRHEILSLITRLVISYTLALIAWMATCSSLGRYSWIARMSGINIGGNPGA